MRSSARRSIHGGRESPHSSCIIKTALCLFPHSRTQVHSTISSRSTWFSQPCFMLSLRLFNPLLAELNPICHLLILLGDLTFMGPCIISTSNKMQRYTVYLYLETALHVSGGTSTHHQERIPLYLLHLVFGTPLLLSAAIVEELEPV
jgi:hypothetical protein